MAELKHVEIELPMGGGGGPSCDILYDQSVDRTIRQSIPLGGKYVSHSTYTVHKLIAKVSYVPPETVKIK